MSVKHTVNPGEVIVVLDENGEEEVQGTVLRFAGRSEYLLKFEDGSEREVSEFDFLGKVIYGEILRFD